MWQKHPNYPMSLLPYALTRPFLFGLDPEAAHDLTISTLSRAQGTPLALAYAQRRVDDPIMVAGLHFPNRVGLAAGLDKNAQCIDAFDAMGFGFVEVGTVTPKAQPGNAKPRLFRLPQAQALINRMGFNNEGLAKFVENVQKARFRTCGRGKQPMLLGLNIGKNADTPMEEAARDYLIGLDAVYPHADYITINISSPNTKNLRALQGDAALDALLGALDQRRAELARQHQRRVPIFVKIAPDLDEAQLVMVAQVLLRYGLGANGEPNQLWGVIATNTTLAREGVAGLPNAAETGGLSGAPLRDASNAVIRKLRADLGEEFPIIGAGGVMSDEDALEKIHAGADLVQIYTGLIYHGPKLVQQAALMIRENA